MATELRAARNSLVVADDGGLMMARAPHMDSAHRRARHRHTFLLLPLLSLSRLLGSLDDLFNGTGRKTSPNHLSGSGRKENHSMHIIFAGER